MPHSSVLLLYTYIYAHGMDRFHEVISSRDKKEESGRIANFYLIFPKFHFLAVSLSFAHLIPFWLLNFMLCV